MVGVIVNFPMPVLAAELKSLTAVGAVAAAGTVIGVVYEMLFVESVQVEPFTHCSVTPVMLDAVVASVCGLPPPVVNCV
jgi:hypothetical protein